MPCPFVPIYLDSHTAYNTLLSQYQKAASVFTPDNRFSAGGMAIGQLYTQMFLKPRKANPKGFLIIKLL